MANNASRRIAVLVATLLGSGFAPLAPGTAGSLAAIAFAAVVARPNAWTPLLFAALTLVFLFPGVWASREYSRAVGKKDPSAVVIDEAIGQWIALAGASVYNWKSVVGAFLLFRLFDIWKPFPARHAERLPHGFGIVADDVVAGAYAGLVMWAMGCFNLY